MTARQALIEFMYDKQLCMKIIGLPADDYITNEDAEEILSWDEATARQVLEEMEYPSDRSLLIPSGHYLCHEMCPFCVLNHGYCTECGYAARRAFYCRDEGSTYNAIEEAAESIPTKKHRAISLYMGKLLQAIKAQVLGVPVPSSRCVESEARTGR